MVAIRTVKEILRARPTLEGAGVHLKRVFGFNEVPRFDPFLLLDDFRSDEPEHYLKGFPWHPHRGIETITYVIKGDVEHGDSLGNRGVIGSGDVQWMTAGSGIIHQEMPRGDSRGRMHGFQLWANLPARDKMMDPRYRDVTSAQIPEVRLADGTLVRVIAGSVGDTRGPVQDIVTQPEYLDVTMQPHASFAHPCHMGHTVFAYIIEGRGAFGCQHSPFAEEDPMGAPPPAIVDNTSLVLFGEGEQVRIFTDTEPVRFLLISGSPIQEPVAWRGPIVMNSEPELQTAFDEYQQGTFIKYRP